MLARAAAVALALLALPAPAQVYRCVHNGQTEFLQAKPKTGQCDEVAAKPPSVITNDSTSHFSQEIDQSHKDEARQQREAQHESDARKRACASARQRQGVLDRFGSRIFSVDEKGEQHYMTEEQYQAERASVGQAIKDNCS